jgi:hypothetical protein
MTRIQQRHGIPTTDRPTHAKKDGRQGGREAGREGGREEGNVLSPEGLEEAPHGPDVVGVEAEADEGSMFGVPAVWPRGRRGGGRGTGAG